MTNHTDHATGGGPACDDASPASAHWVSRAYQATVQQLLSDFADVGLSLATLTANVRSGDLDSLQEYALVLISMRADDLPGLVACAGDLRTASGVNNRIWHAAAADKNIVNRVATAGGTLSMTDDAVRGLVELIPTPSHEETKRRRLDVVTAALEERDAPPKFRRAVIRRLHRKGYTAEATSQILEALNLGAQRRRLATVAALAHLSGRADVVRFAQFKDEGWTREEIRAALGVSPAQLRTIERHLQSYQNGLLVPGKGGARRARVPVTPSRPPLVEKESRQLALPLANAPAFTFVDHAF